MSKGKDLGLERGSSSKALPDAAEEGENDREHDIGNLQRRRVNFN
jgi:hypothetical protein